MAGDGKAETSDDGGSPKTSKPSRLSANITKAMELELKRGTTVDLLRITKKTLKSEGKYFLKMAASFNLLYIVPKSEQPIVEAYDKAIAEGEPPAPQYLLKRAREKAIWLVDITMIRIGKEVKQELEGVNEEEDVSNVMYLTYDLVYDDSAPSKLLKFPDSEIFKVFATSIIECSQIALKRYEWNPVPVYLEKMWQYADQGGDGEVNTRELHDFLEAANFKFEDEAQLIRILKQEECDDRLTRTQFMRVLRRLESCELGDQIWRRYVQKGSNKMTVEQFKVFLQSEQNEEMAKEDCHEMMKNIRNTLSKGTYPPKLPGFTRDLFNIYFSQSSYNTALHVQWTDDSPGEVAFDSPPDPFTQYYINTCYRASLAYPESISTLYSRVKDHLKAGVRALHFRILPWDDNDPQREGKALVEIDESKGKEEVDYFLQSIAENGFNENKFPVILMLELVWEVESLDKFKRMQMHLAKAIEQIIGDRIVRRGAFIDSVSANEGKVLICGFPFKQIENNRFMRPQFGNLCALNSKWVTTRDDLDDNLRGTVYISRVDRVVRNCFDLETYHPELAKKIDQFPERIKISRNIAAEERLYEENNPTELDEEMLEENARLFAERELKRKNYMRNCTTQKLFFIMPDDTRPKKQQKVADFPCPSMNEAGQWDLFSNPLDSPAVVKCWSNGVQMAAVNLHIADMARMVGVGQFIQNRHCGYVLKPWSLRGIPEYIPEEKKEEDDDDLDVHKEHGKDEKGKGTEKVLRKENDRQPPWFKCGGCTISIKIMSGFHIPKCSATYGGGGFLKFILSSNGEGISNPFVVVRVDGSGYDNNVYKPTTHKTWNGLSPTWNEMVDIPLERREHAIISVMVFDFRNEKNNYPFLCGISFPASCIRTGYRVFRMFNNKGEYIPENPILLVNVNEFSSGNLNDLLAQLEKLELSNRMLDTRNNQLRKQVNERSGRLGKEYGKTNEIKTQLDTIEKDLTEVENKYCEFHFDQCTIQ